jgi:hypothetical protein
VVVFAAANFKEDVMKVLRSMVFAAGLLAVVSGVKAQSPTRVVANVPFNFVANDQAYESGKYTLSQEGTPAIVIHDEDTSDSKITLTHNITKMKPAEKSVLVFHRVGDQYFLSQIWVAGRTEGRVLPESKIEKQMAKNVNEKDVVIYAQMVR